MISIKSANEISIMKEGGKILAALLKLLEQNAKAGITTHDLDKIAADFIKKNKSSPSFLDYNGYPASICVSIDDEVVHGIPDKKRKIQEGQLVSIDAGIYFGGFHTDAARTFAIGEVSPEKQKLKEVTEQCFFEGIKRAVEGNRIIDISTAIQNHAHQNNFSVVTALVGHGIGKMLHEEPSIPNYIAKTRGAELKCGMTLAVEPMINAGSFEIYFASDGWTCKTKDKKPSAHYENTILITKNGCEILTIG